MKPQVMEIVVSYVPIFIQERPVEHQPVSHSTKTFRVPSMCWILGQGYGRHKDE